jgi:hypothetical protein
MREIKGGNDRHGGSATLVNVLMGTSVAILALLVLLLPRPVRAQFASADVLGTVTDQMGAVVPGATITIKNSGTGITHMTKTGTSGEYLFSALQIGAYEVTVEAKGFRKFVATNVTLTAGDRARVDAKMTVGQASETVNVSAESAAALQTDTSTVGTEIPSTNIQDVPLSGRNLTDLVLMTAGVQTSVSGSKLNNGCQTTSQNGPATPDDCRASSGYVVNGQSDLNQNNTLDGMDNNDRRIGEVEVKPSIDAIEEVKVQTSLYSAESGRTSGGVVQIITKSGSNKFKGSLYEYLRNDMFDAATTWSQSAKPMLRQNQFGGTIGGPILKNKTFFFADYEGLRIHSSTSQNGTEVPTPTMISDVKSGNIANINADLASYLGSIGQSGTLGVVPAGSTLDPVAQNLFQLFPTVTGGNCSVGYYCGNVPRIQTSNTADLRIDQHFNDRNTLYGRYSYNLTNTTNAGSLPASTVNGLTFTPGGTYSQQPEDNLSLDYAHVYRPNLVLDLKAGYTYSKNFGAASDPLNDAAALGLSCGAGVSCPTVTAASSARSGLPGISGIGSVTNGGGPPGPGGGGGWSVSEQGNIPLLVRNHVHQFVASLTWTKGTQNIKFGATLIDRQLIESQSQNIYGTIGFAAGNGPGANTATVNYLLGQASSKAQSFVAVQQHLRTFEPSAYFQDDWRVFPKLTLNLGVRYDLYTPYTEEDGYLSNFDPNTVYATNGVTYTGVLVSPDLLGAQHSNKYANLPIDMHDFQPRLGFAYSLPQDGFLRNMVLRGGFGMSYYPNTVGMYTTSANAPFSYSLTCGASGGGPGGGTATPFGSPNTTCSNVDGKLDDGFPVPNTGAAAVQAMATDPTQYASEGSIYSISSSLKTSYQYQYSLQAQKDWHSNIVTVGYVGNLGRHLANFGYGNTTVDSLKYNPANNFGVPFYDETQYTCADGSTSLTNPAGCNVNSGDVTADSPISLSTFFSNDASDYNAMQASFLRRSSSGLTTSINYTYAHLMNNEALVGEGAGLNPICWTSGCRVDNGSGSAATAKVEDQGQYDWGNGDLDMRHRVSGVLTYQLPFARNSHGILNAVAAGWTANLMGTLQAGMHYTATAMAGPPGGSGGSLSPGSQVISYTSCVDPWTLNQDQQVNPNAVNTPWCPTTWNGIGSDARPNMICDPDKSSKGNWHRSLNDYFNTNCLTLQQYQTFGAERRGQLVAPGMKRADISMIKQFNLHENYGLQLRMEGFNITNTPSYGEPSFSTGCNSFDTSGASNCTAQTLATDLTAAGTSTLPVLSNPSSCISQRTSTSSTPGPPGSGATACISTIQGINRQFQFALKLTF